MPALDVNVKLIAANPRLGTPISSPDEGDTKHTLGTQCQTHNTHGRCNEFRPRVLCPLLILVYISALAFHFGTIFIHAPSHTHQLESFPPLQLSQAHHVYSPTRRTRTSRIQHITYTAPRDVLARIHSAEAHGVHAQKTVFHGRAWVRQEEARERRYMPGLPRCNLRRGRYRAVGLASYYNNHRPLFNTKSSFFRDSLILSAFSMEKSGESCHLYCNSQYPRRVWSRLPRIATIIGHFSIQNHRVSGAILHYLCILNGTFLKKLGLYCNSQYLGRGHDARALEIASRAIASWGSKERRELRDLAEMSAGALEQKWGRRRFVGRGRRHRALEQRLVVGGAREVRTVAKGTTHVAPAQVRLMPVVLAVAAAVRATGNPTAPLRRGSLHRSTERFFGAVEVAAAAIAARHDPAMTYARSVACCIIWCCCCHR